MRAEIKQFTNKFNFLIVEEFVDLQQETDREASQCPTYPN